MNFRAFGGAARLRVEGLARLRVRQLGRLVRRAGWRLAGAIRRRERGAVYVVLGQVPARDDPARQALLSCLRIFANAGVHVHLLLLDYVGDADQAISGLRDHGLSPAAATVKIFWRDASPTGDGGAYAQPMAGTQPTTAVRMPGSPSHTMYFRDGLPVIAVTGGGRAVAVEHFGSFGAPVRRDDYDERGRLVRTQELVEDTGEVATYRYLDGDGSCWLSAWIDHVSGRSGPLQQHRPTRREFATYSDVWAYWVTRQLRVSATPLIISVDSVGAEVVGKSRHPAAYRVRIDPDAVGSADPNSVLEFYAYATSANSRRRRSRVGTVTPPPPLSAG